MRTFTEDREYLSAIEIINYYRFSSVPLKYSYFKILASNRQEEILLDLKKKERSSYQDSYVCLNAQSLPSHYRAGERWSNFKIHV